MNTTEIVYKSKDNTNVVAFTEDNVAMDFSAVTRVILRLYNRTLTLVSTVDSNDSPSLISWATNQITFTIGSVSVDDGIYKAEVVIYDSTRPNGQAITHPESNGDKLTFRYVT